MLQFQKPLRYVAKNLDSMLSDFEVVVTRSIALIRERVAHSWDFTQLAVL